MPKVIHFGLPADDPKQALAFYERVFGRTTITWEGPNHYGVISVGPEDEQSNGALVPTAMAEDTINVESVDESARKIEKAGATVTVPKQAIPDIGYIAYCTDTEGNLFGILEPDTSVK